MKKTISLAALAVSASTSFAFIGGNGPIIPREHKTYCLDVYRDMNGAMVAGACDLRERNIAENVPVNQNGCANEQISITTNKQRGAPKFPIEIRSCLPPNVTQL